MEGEGLLRRLLSFFARKAGPLYAAIIVTSLFSPLILNDVVILILTPVLVKYSKDSGRDIAPLLVGEITFTNIASSLTPLGNPQNILLWDASGLGFIQFLQGTWLPILLSGAIAALALLPLRKHFTRAMEVQSSRSALPGVYLGLIIIALLLSDLSSVPVYVTLGAVFLLGFLFTFRSPRQILKDLDLKSLLTLYVFLGLITVISLLVGPELGKLTSPVAEGVQPVLSPLHGRSLGHHEQRSCHPARPCDLDDRPTRGAEDCRRGGVGG